LPFPKRAGPYVIDWGKELDLRFKEWQVETKSEALPSRTAIKRSAGDDGNSVNKKSKTTDELSDLDMKSHYKNGTLDKVSIVRTDNH
jgi:hypothetical protein